jgi:cysteine desulfurase
MSIRDERVYFDWNATAPMRPEARAAMLSALDVVGNASSVHAEGRAARQLVEDARTEVAALVGAKSKNVIFTSGASEANMLALTPWLEFGGRKEPRDRLFVSAIEHPSVLSGGRFAPGLVEQVPVTSDGILDLAALEAQLAKSERPLVSVMLANNETGIVQPIRAIADIVHAGNGVLHVDAVQGAGRLNCDIEALGADLMSISSHKLGGPQGAGALVRQQGAGALARREGALVRRDDDIRIASPLITGGGQERGQRAGTENVAAIAGFGAACAGIRFGKQAEIARMSGLRDKLEAGIQAATPEAIIYGSQVSRVPNTTLVALLGLRAETAVIALDLQGIAVSSGSACSSGKVQPSHVLAAMGVTPELARGVVRISLGWTSTEKDIGTMLSAWIKVVSSLFKKRRTEGIAA